MGEFWLGQFAKYMIKREFYGFEGSIAVSFSHSDFGFVVQALDDAAGECLLGAKVIEQEFPMIAHGFDELLERLNARAHYFGTLFPPTPN